MDLFCVLGLNDLGEEGRYDLVRVSRGKSVNLGTLDRTDHENLWYRVTWSPEKKS